MSTRIFVFIGAPEPITYYAIPDSSGDPERAGWWKVVEGNYPEAPIVAWCPSEVFAVGVATALNRHRAIVGHRAVLTIAAPGRHASCN